MISVDKELIDKNSLEFLKNSIGNPFYSKKIFFTQGLRGNKYLQFQIAGNMGGFMNDYEFTVDTDFYIVADSLIEALNRGLKDAQLQQLEKKLNEKGKRYEKLQIISEDIFISHVRNRCIEINDLVTLDLIDSIP